MNLDFRLLTEALRIPKEEVTFVEDVWLGPNAFGYSLEYFVRGLELGNAVFTEFLGTPENYTVMKEKIIDMGAGLDRFCWLSQGTPTLYDAVFGPVSEKLLSMADYDRNFYSRYSSISGKLNLDEVADIKIAKKGVASELGVGVEDLTNMTSPIEALYAIADHSKTLLYAITDGALPSNVGGGYNLRVILRRALGFIEEYGFDIDLADVCEWHANHLKRFSPRLINAMDEVREILDVEKGRFKSTEKKNYVFVKNLLEKTKNIDAEKLFELYESRGITPEFIEGAAKKIGIDATIPANFYDNLSSNHMKEKSHKEISINTEGIAPTRLLFYESRETKFTARVIRIIDSKYVILDRTAFFGRAGGQEPDNGFIGKCRVYDVEKIGGVIVHHVENPGFDVGDEVEGDVDLDRRMQLTMNHTAIHIINGAARKVLGNHVWQAGANKNVDKAHLDITHFRALTEDEVENIEETANNIVSGGVNIIKSKMPRNDAEQKYGMRIYQGGVIPEKDLNIIEIPNFDTEGCGGTHADNTLEIGRIVVLSTERIQDGVVRISITSWKSADRYIENRKQIILEVGKILKTSGDDILKKADSLFNRWKKSRKISPSHDLEEKYKIFDNKLIEVIENADMKKLQSLSRSVSSNDTFVFLVGMSENVYVLCAAGKNTGIDAKKIIDDVCNKLGGSGGGSPLIAQGFGTKKDKVEEVVDFVRNML